MGGRKPSPQRPRIARLGGSSGADDRNDDIFTLKEVAQYLKVSGIIVFNIDAAVLSLEW